jgi:hypothetical protein
VHDTRVTWGERAEAAVARYRAGETHEADQRQLTQLGNAAWAAGLAFLMDGRRGESQEWLRGAAMRYRESWEGAPHDSWGRPIAAMKSLLIAGDDASEAARWAIEAGAADAESPIGVYAGALALLVLGEDTAAGAAAGTLRDREDFPSAVADALAALAVADREGYAAAVAAVLDSFEDRTDFLEDMPVADTVLVLQALASRRGVAVELRASALLP